LRPREGAASHGAEAPPVVVPGRPPGAGDKQGAVLGLSYVEKRFHRGIWPQRRRIEVLRGASFEGSPSADWLGMAAVALGALAVAPAAFWSAAHTR
jgi:hypothetical protein